MTDYATHISEALDARLDVALPRMRRSLETAFMAGAEAALSWQRRERGPCAEMENLSDAGLIQILRDSGNNSQRLDAARELVRRLEAEQREEVRDG